MADSHSTADRSSADRADSTDRIVSPGSDISPDTSVVGDPERGPSGTSATPEDADPEALIAGNRVSTGRELETD